MLQNGRVASSSIRASRNILPRTFCRYRSITAAIERGRGDPLDRRPARSNQRDRFTPRVPSRDVAEGGEDRFRRGYRNRDGHVDTRRRWDDDGDSFQGPRDVRGNDYGNRTSSLNRESLPYTTAASEFLYGYSSVLAALKANRRRLYKLYVLPRGMNNERSAALLTRAKRLKVTIQEVGDEYLPAFSKASSGRPHNGFIMETSPLPVPNIFALGPCSVMNNEYQVSRAQQSKEEQAVNGTQRIFPYHSDGWRYPLVIYADGVLDEGNLGAIARSAYLLGVDAIVTPTRQSAPWSHVAIKASAGAAEAIPIFSVSRPYDFLVNSARDGWRIYASSAIPPAPVNPTQAHPVKEEEPYNRLVYTFARTAKRLPEGHSPVNEHPTILMMGAEDHGLRDSLVNAAHYKVGIRHGRKDEVGVDSLNVSVAASLLCYEMLQRPRKSKDLLF